MHETISTALVRATNPISRAWALAMREPLCVVTNGRVYLVEPPWERADVEAERALEEGREPAEAALRLFTDYEDAVRYCEQQQDEHDADSAVMHVASVTLEAVWALLPVIQSNSNIAYGVPVRVDLCRFGNDGRPVVIDSLVASFTTFN